MRKIKFIVFLLPLLLIACSLNGEQERKLNETLSSYLFARNECQLVNYVALTSPEVVRFYKEKGDSAFISRFDCSKDSFDLEDPIIEEVRSEGSAIQVSISLKQISYNAASSGDKNLLLIALSDDGGRSWFFMDRSDYVDKSSYPKLMRLLDN